MPCLLQRTQLPMPRAGVHGSRVVAVLLASLLCACANDGQRTRAEGAAIGAVGGAVAGRVIGGDKQGAVAGAIGGSLLGLFVGDQVADKKARYASQEDELRSSADHALALADASRARNAQLSKDISALDQSVERLRKEEVSAAARQVRVDANRKQLRALMASVDKDLAQLRNESARQSVLLDATTSPAQRGAAAQPSDGARRVSASVRELDQQTRELELARQQLQQIDQRRAY